MKRKRKQRKIRVFFWILLFIICQLCVSVTVLASQSEDAETQVQTKQELLENLELGQMQDTVNELLGEDTFSLKEALERIFRGEQIFSKEFMGTVLKEFLYRHLLVDKETLIQVVVLILLAALFSNFADVFGKGQAGEISFYVVYMLLLVILIHSFSDIGQGIVSSLDGFVTFMKALMPSYFLAVTAASGSASAMVFYETVLIVIYVVQAILLKAVIPGIHAYVLLQMVNYLHNEDFLSKMADLLRTLLEWTMNTCTAAIIGMQIIQNMISPAVDSLKRDMLGKTAAAIPGVGNAINGVTEVALGTAVLIRNGLGVMGILILIILGLPPVVKLGMNTLLYKFLAAIVQPVSDNRMVGCLSTVGDGCRLLLRVLLMVELLLLITIAILSVSFITY